MELFKKAVIVGFGFYMGKGIYEGIKYIIGKICNKICEKNNKDEPVKPTQQSKKITDNKPYTECKIGFCANLKES